MVMSAFSTTTLFAGAPVSEWKPCWVPPAPLAAAGSAAAQGQGAFAVTQGTPIFAPDGDRIGRVRQVVADAHGNVQQVLVRVDGETASLPASYFQASGSGLISVVGEGQIKRMAEQQEAAEDAK